MASPTRRDFIRTAAAGAAGLSLGASSGPGPAVRPLRLPETRRQDRPNLLLVTTDYQAGEDGPTLGSSFLEMPSLRRLSEEGVVLEGHTCTAPICMPARYTLITGQYPHTHGQWENGGTWLPEGSPVLMEHLRAAGYHTVGIGKMHFQPWDRMAGFDRRIIADRKGNTIRDRDYPDDYARFLAEHGLDRWSYLRKQAEADIFGVYDWPFAERFHIDRFVGDAATGLVEAGELTDPWFLWVSFNGPHNPWDPPAEYSDPYKRMELPPPRTRPGELDEKPMDQTRLRYNYTRQVGDLMDREPGRRADIVHRIRAGHYGGLAFIDVQLGRLLDALEGRGLLDDTVVVYSADHGCHLGDHDLIHKGTYYERSSRVPFVVWSPARFRPARRRAFSGHVDVLPTLLGLAGAPVPVGVEGRDLAPVLRGDEAAIRDASFMEIRWSTGIATDRYKLAVYPRDGEGELYDLEADPDELVNRYADPAHREVVEALTRRLVGFHPPLAEEIRDFRPPSFADRPTWRLDAGTHLPSVDAPYQRGRPIRVEVAISPGGGPADGWPDGPLFVTSMDGVHGYALYMRAGHPELAVRRWGEDRVILAPEALPARAVRLGLALGSDGVATLSVDGEPVSAGAVGGLLPEQPGRDRLLAGDVFVGRSPAGRPMGAYEAEAVFSGQLDGAVLRVG